MLLRTRHWTARLSKKHYYALGVVATVLLLLHTLKAYHGKVALRPVLSRPHVEGYEYTLPGASQKSAFRFLDLAHLETLAAESSPGSGLFKKATEAQRDLAMFKEWASLSRMDQCRLLVKGIYVTDPQWSTKELFGIETVSDDSRAELALALERLRIYNYCFKHESSVTPYELFHSMTLPREVMAKMDLPPYERMNKKQLALALAVDYQRRMFPFLKKTGASFGKYLHPKLINLRTGKMSNQPTVKSALHEYNSNFIQHWVRQSYGRGIVIPMDYTDLKELYHNLKVWQTLKNTLPIQLVFSNTVVTAEVQEILFEYAKETKQNLFIVDLEPILDVLYVHDQHTPATSKVLASMFNTFEEALVMEPDVSFFLSANTVFDSEDYKNTGFKFWKGRNTRKDAQFPHCKVFTQALEPSLEEFNMIHSELVVRLDNPSLESPNTEQEKALSSYYTYGGLHYADNGVYVINKKQAFEGLLGAATLLSHKKYRLCSDGENEFMWLGMFTVGNNFVSDSIDAGILGEIKLESEGPRRGYAYVCGTQVSHSDDVGRLVWSKDGLVTCKFENAAHEDFSRDSQYFTDRYLDEHNLDEIYKSKLNINGFIVPDTRKNPWKQISECRATMYCAYIPHLKSNTDDEGGILASFGGGYLTHIKDVVNARLEPSERERRELQAKIDKERQELEQIEHQLEEVGHIVR